MGKTMDIYSPRGTKVCYTGKNGYDYDKDYANQHLKAGEVYTVCHTDVSKWGTEVFLVEVPGLEWGFNSVHFTPVEVVAEGGNG